uniref:UBP-type zinc finger domain-containing protein n=1 Tax=Gordonia sp. B7-2 TaxID=3420932 RepID=UPI003D8CEBCA
MRIFGRQRPSRSGADSGTASAARCPELGEIGLDASTDPAPRTGNSRACEGCVALGEDHWAHLRMCLTCGHVGCCDSSPRRHATGHFEATGHPVMRSAEPGEAWRWCYIHEVMG